MATMPKAVIEVQVREVAMNTRCDICGKFVSRDRWTRKDHPRNAKPLCDTCWRDAMTPDRRNMVANVKDQARGSRAGEDA